MKEDFKDLSASFIVVNPIPEIDGACQRKSYLEAFALSVTYFEYYGYLKLINKISREKLNKMGANKIREELFSRKMIDKSTNDNMKIIIKKRNELIHPKGNITLKYMMKKDEIILIDLAKKCIEYLMTIKP